MHYKGKRGPTGEQLMICTIAVILLALALTIHGMAACTGIPPMEQIRQAAVEVEMT